jgi:predicted MPP superfamily phosphohydrolase
MPLFTHNTLRLTERRIPLQRLPHAFEGFKIAQISDLHFYEYTDHVYYDRVVEAVNALAPDVIVLTGDVVHYGPDFIPAAGDFLRRLEARHARLAILGNHDYQDGAMSRHIAAMYADIGFELLVNASRAIERDGHRFWFAGLDDLYYGQPDITRALSGVPTQDEMTIMLAHNPLLFDPVAMAGQGRVDLVISGHTHAGHIYIPPLGPIYRKIFRMKYRYGLFEKNGCRLHVTSGVGSAAFYLKKRRIGFPRLRFNTHPEIAALELISSKA